MATMRNFVAQSVRDFLLPRAVGSLRRRKDPQSPRGTECQLPHEPDRRESSPDGHTRQAIVANAELRDENGPARRLFELFHKPRQSCCYR